MLNENEKLITATELSVDEIQPFAEKAGFNLQIFNEMMQISVNVLASFCPTFRATFSKWHWKMISLSNGGFIMEPVPPKELNIHQLHMTNPMNYFDKDISIPTAGIIATIFGLSYAMESVNDKCLHENYMKVLDYGYQQSESSLIAAAID